ncbi:hypothetical protein I656_03020 [Geobacillus sp. WSUCF1]|nr:hypothetical protein I656_03020 [Geobacillus sp. WSUCF1]
MIFLPVEAYIFIARTEEAGDACPTISFVGLEDEAESRLARGRRIHSGRQPVALFIFCACISFFDIIYYF